MRLFLSKPLKPFYMLLEKLFEEMEDFDKDSHQNLEQLNVWSEVVQEFNDTNGTQYKMSSVLPQYIKWQREKQER